MTKLVFSDTGARLVMSDGAAARFAADAEAARDEANQAAFDATTALDLVKLDLYGDPNDKDASLILDFAPNQYLGKADATFSNERILAMVKTDLSSGPALVSQATASFVTSARSTTATRVNSAGLIETVGAGVMRINYDPVTKECRGFLSERGSTNLLLRSAEFDSPSWAKDGLTVTPNAVSAPDGTMTADTLTTNATNGPHRLVQSAVITGTATHTQSIWARAGTHPIVQLFNGASSTFYANFVLANGAVGAVGSNTTARIEDWGGGWYRCIATYNGAAITLNNSHWVNIPPTISAAHSAVWGATGTETVHIWGAQLEPLPYATSVILTAASQVTRAADIMTISGANLPRFFNAPEGTFVVEYDYAGGPSSAIGSNRFLTNIDSGSVTNSFLLYNGSNNAGHIYAVSGGAVQASIGGGGVAPPNVPQKLAFGYAVNNYAISVNGGAPFTDTDGDLPIGLNRMQIGSGLDGRIKSIRYFPTRLSNAQLQELSAL